jgi:pimeloyl-ACP methyl ester carboxylesterase
MPAFPKAKRIKVSSSKDGRPVHLAVHEMTPDQPRGTVVLCHGFPDLAYGWRHQLPVLAEAGFRVIAPNQRGYAESSAPERVDDYGLSELDGDLVGLLDALEVEKAWFVGHDWGGFVAWGMPVLHPERVLGVAALCTPYMPFPSVERHLEVVAGASDRQYVAWFQEPGVAEATMDAHVRPILTRILRTGVSLEESVRAAFADGALNMNPFKQPEAWPILGELLGSPEDLDVYVRAYEAAGFRGGINWYRNIDRNAADHPDIGRQPLEIPCLMLTADWDPGLRPEYAADMHERCSDLEMHNIERAGHWIQQEYPDEVNRYLLGWLERVTANGDGASPGA